MATRPSIGLRRFRNHDRFRHILGSIIALPVLLVLSVISRAVCTAVQHPTSHEGTVVAVTSDFRAYPQSTSGDMLAIQLAGVDSPVPHAALRTSHPDAAALEATAPAVHRQLSQLLVGQTDAIRFSMGAVRSCDPRPPLPHLYQYDRWSGLSTADHRHCLTLEEKACRNLRGLWTLGDDLPTHPAPITTPRLTSPLPSPRQGS